MVVKVKILKSLDTLKKTTSKKYNLRGQRNVKYHDRILSNTKKSFF